MPLPTTPTLKGSWRAISFADSPYAAVPATLLKNSRRRIVSSLLSSVMDITVRRVSIVVRRAAASVPAIPHPQGRHETLGLGALMRVAQGAGAARGDPRRRG